MSDSLGWRKKFAIIIPSTNTSVQPEMDGMRPQGVTNHISRIDIPNLPLRNNDDFSQLIQLIDDAQMAAVDRVMSSEPDHLILGISAETFWNGAEASQKLKATLEARSGLSVSMGAEACDAAIKCYGAKRLGVITPYQPIGDEMVVKFLEEMGYQVGALKGLKCESPVLIAHASEEVLREAILEVDGPGIDAILQVGTNLAMARLAGEAERWLGKPVIAINTAIYWQALRANKIQDKISGWGSLLTEY